MNQLDYVVAITEDADTLFTVLNDFSWKGIDIGFKNAKDKKNHAFEVFGEAVSSGSPFDELDFTVDTLKQSIGKPRFNKGNNAIGMGAKRTDKRIGIEFGFFETITPIRKEGSSVGNG